MDRRPAQSVRTLLFDDSDSHKTKKPSNIVITSTSEQTKSIEDEDPIDASDIGETNNLVRMRRSALGKSAPSLSAHMKELCVSRRPSRLPALPPHHRLSIASANYDDNKWLMKVGRCGSPGGGPLSPADAPRSMPLHHALLSSSLKRNKDIDGRRWSVASLPSSGYGTTPGSSSLSSLLQSNCSSQERLLIPQHTDVRTPCPHCAIHRTSSPFENVSIPRRPRSRSAGGSTTEGRLSRSRSPANSSPADDDAVAAMSALFAARFPAAQQDMNNRLIQLVNELTELEKKTDRSPIERFVHHQLLEMTRDCLHKSESKQVTSTYFFDMTDSLERLLAETQEKSSEAGAAVSPLVTRLMLAMARPSRLLQCLEFDPANFYRLLEAAEGHARHYQGITTDIPQYIIHKLGLSKDPLAELQAPVPEGTPVCTPPPSGTSSNAGDAPSEQDYQIVKLISNGAYGAVYLVKHKQTRQRYAMKKISKNNLILRNQVDQAFAERDILSFADNPFVVSMYCSFETRRHVCLVMELVEGGDCAALLRNGPLPPDMARHYFAEAVLAVEYLHSYGIVHRDLKPDNLLITATGHIKLTDFGLSKMGLMSLATNLYEEYADREARQFSDKQVCGTPEYIAPEVILRQGYGKPVDWWSMGIILYEFLIGCVPFFGETPEELFAHTVNDDIEWPSEDDFPIAVEARAIITELLARNPRDRLGTNGTHQVKEHNYFLDLDWNNLLRRKAEFIPQLENDEDTSYFDSRCDRYNHTEAEVEDPVGGASEEVFAAFSSTSPQYRRQLSDHNQSRSTDSWPGTPDSSGPPNLINHTKCQLLCGATSTAESSQTDSDDVSPAARRRPIAQHQSKKEDSGQDKLDKSSSKNLLLAPGKSIRRSASTSGLSLIIHPPDDIGNTSSTNSSRDSSPCRDGPDPFLLDSNALIQASKPPIVIKRGPRGFGFTIHTVRVYYGDTDFYTMHHLISSVSENGAAWSGGLRAGDVLTQVNGESVAGLLHTQVVRLLLQHRQATIRAATPRAAHILRRRRSRPPPPATHHHHRALRPKPRRRSSLLRKISNRRAEQMAGESPSSPASPDAPPIHYQRPSSLHGLKHKLSGVAVSPLARTPDPASPTAASPSRRAGPSPLLRRALSPDRLHNRSVNPSVSVTGISVNSGTGPVNSGSNTGNNGGGENKWRGWSTPPPTAPTTDAPLPRIAEEKDSPTHHAKQPPSTPIRPTISVMFTSSPISEHLACPTPLDLSHADTTLSSSCSLPPLDSTATSLDITCDMSVPIGAVTQTDASFSSISSCDGTHQKAPPSHETSPEPLKLSRENSIRKSTKKNQKDPDESKNRKAEQKKSEPKKELKRQDSETKRELDKEKSQDNLDGGDTSKRVGSSNTSMVSKILGVMGRKNERNTDEQLRSSKKADKHNKNKKGGNQTNVHKTENSSENSEQNKPRRQRGRMSSSSSGEK